jgi:hypothetical protein
MCAAASARLQSACYLLLPFSNCADRQEVWPADGSLTERYWRRAGCDFPLALSVPHCLVCTLRKTLASAALDAVRRIDGQLSPAFSAGAGPDPCPALREHLEATLVTVTLEER